MVFICWLRDFGLAEVVDDAEVVAKHREPPLSSRTTDSASTETTQVSVLLEVTENSFNRLTSLAIQ